jgi:hypothetical protein
MISPFEIRHFSRCDDILGRNETEPRRMAPADPHNSSRCQGFPLFGQSVIVIRALKCGFFYVSSFSRPSSVINISIVDRFSVEIPQHRDINRSLIKTTGNG